MSYYGHHSSPTTEISVGSEYVTIITHNRTYDTTALARILRRETDPDGNEVIVLDRRVDSESNPLRESDKVWWRVGEFATELHSQQPKGVKSDDGEDP